MEKAPKKSSFPQVKFGKNFERDFRKIQGKVVKIKPGGTSLKTPWFSTADIEQTQRIGHE